jgi:hypothetical protein
MTTLYDPGLYRVRIENQQLGETTNGNPQFVLTFTPLGEHDLKDNTLLACPSLPRSAFMTITDNTVDFVLETLRHLGFQGTSFAQLDPSTEAFHDFKGIECDAYCKHEEYDGKTKEKWNISRGKGSVNVKPLEKKSIRALDAKFGKKLLATASATPASPPISKETPTATEDIPF